VTPATTHDLARRALAALVDRPVRAATATRPVPGGVLVLTADYPASHEHNKALLTAPAVPEDVLRAVEQTSAAAGLDHVRIDVLTPGLAGPLAARALPAGYERGEELLMVLPAAAAERLAVAPPDQRVGEGTWEQVRAFVAESWRAALPGATPDVVEQLVERRHATARAVRIVHLAATIDGPGGRVVAATDLFMSADDEGTVAQVENVQTAEHARGRGLARALVTAAVARAHADGATCVFLVADAQDWPREFYGRLGFEPATTTTVLTRTGRPDVADIHRG
jgi:predicted N-acetyltransferase YhbS